MLMIVVISKMNVEALPGNIRAPVYAGRTVKGGPNGDEGGTEVNKVIIKKQ
ncbi:hypothetical protein QA612_19330 [Evansella sp. AB-P1]|uniref:hypothetical protein n=1 Tax=Evansella sp. AB-P1 TaxID=3037653 RepID=UPI00241DF2C4|nr:hypothetical protein [Evansella sp. AB-P1]MDG5789614.1 hypothetical protein [Evansella sp. AB-P1]